MARWFRHTLNWVETPSRWRTAPRWMTLVWLLWVLALFGSYFYHMLTIPDRWDKIVELMQRLVP